MPKALSEEAVAKMLWDAQRPDVDRLDWERIDRVSMDGWLRMARAVLALVREKVREGVEAAAFEVINGKPTMDFDAIVARVMWREAPRG